MKKLFALIGFLVLALAAVTAGCGGKDEKAVYKTVLKDEVIVCTEAAFAPFEYKDEKTGELAGFDMDLIRAVAKEIGFKKCTVVDIRFDDLIPAINAHKADISIAGLTITDERKKQVLFSQPYYKSGLSFIIRKDATDSRSGENYRRYVWGTDEKTGRRPADL